MLVPKVHTSHATTNIILPVLRTMGQAVMGMALSMLPTAITILTLANDRRKGLL